MGAAWRLPTCNCSRPTCNCGDTVRRRLEVIAMSGRRPTANFRVMLYRRGNQMHPRRDAAIQLHTATTIKQHRDPPQAPWCTGYPQGTAGRGSCMERAAQANEPGSGGQAQLRQQSNSKVRANSNVRASQHAVASGAQCTAHPYRGRLPQTPRQHEPHLKMDAKPKRSMQATPKRQKQCASCTYS